VHWIGYVVPDRFLEGAEMELSAAGDVIWQCGGDGREWGITSGVENFGCAGRELVLYREKSENGGIGWGISLFRKIQN
jgi:hypothetical protein